MREELRIALTEERDKIQRVENGGVVIFKIRMRYKSGASEDFWVKSFSYNDGEWSWESLKSGNRPIKMGVDDIESVWQVDVDVMTDAEVKEFFG